MQAGVTESVKPKRHFVSFREVTGGGKWGFFPEPGPKGGVMSLV
jgi:hypothetical protein